MHESGQSQSGPVVATYTIGTDGELRIADRHSEHVACAGGEQVLAAGEITFDGRGPELKVSEVTNQSTGYCPGPECWPAVEQSLKAIGIPHPAGFTTQFIFRRCRGCGSINIVKEEWYVCAVCESDL